MPDRKYQEVFLQTIITYTFLLAVGADPSKLLEDNTYFAEKLFGSIQKASEMNTIFNRKMRES